MAPLAPFQTSPTESVLNGQEYWRLNRQIFSAGDVFLSDQSFRAIVIGPESDIARVRVTYLDLQASSPPVNVITFPPIIPPIPATPQCVSSSIEVSVTKPMVGRLDARVDAYTPLGGSGRLIISLADLTPYRGGIDGIPAATSAIIVQPNIDLICYTNEEPEFIAPRSDKLFQYDTIPLIGPGAPSAILLPFYGRRFAEVTVKNPFQVGQPAITVDVYGINLSTVVDFTVYGDTGHQAELLGTMALAAPAGFPGPSDSLSIQNRSFDYLELVFSAAAPPLNNRFYAHVVMSDQA